MDVANIPLKVLISKTADRTSDYMQITSDDGFLINIVLVSSKITIEDARGRKKSR